MDAISLQRIETVHPKLRVELRQIYREVTEALKGRAICRITQALRTFAEQDALFAQGRTKPGKKVTNARAGQSFHNYGLAVDFCLVINDREVSWDMAQDYDQDGMADWKEVVSIFKKHGWVWGGDWSSFKDYPHFDKNLGHTIKQCAALYWAGKRDANDYLVFN